MNKQETNSELEIKSILDLFFSQREDKIYQSTENEKELLQKKSEDYSKIYIALDNIPEVFEETRKRIETNIETYIDTLSSVQAMENEKFYKTGFSDAIKLIIDCLCKNPSNKKEL